MSADNGAGHPWFELQNSMIEEGFRNLRRMARMPRLWEQAQALTKGFSPSEIVYQENQIRVLHYLSDEPPRYRTPLIFVFALVNRSYILDLKRGKSVVEHFVKRGFDVYLLDWGVPTDADRFRTMEDYIDGYLVNVVDHVRESSGSEQVSFLGYCMGGTMSSIFTALYPQRVANLILLAAGIDFATREGLLNLWSDERYFDVDKFVDVFGNCPAEFLQASFQFLKPVQNMIQKPMNFMERLDDPKFVEDFLAMEMWLNDNIPVPGEVYRKFVKDLYHQNLLTKGRFRLGNRRVDLRNITCPVLNLMARNDDLVPPSQSLPFNDLVGSEDRKAIVFAAGHIGMAVGSKAQRDLWPQVCDWLGERTEAVKESAKVKK
jgi:polyhydroxyalkanoate synthase subunit PhaC